MDAAGDDPRQAQGRRRGARAEVTAPVASGRVLPTLNTDGSRNWIRPKVSDGKWWRRRRIVAWALIAFFVSLPWVRIAGRPAILLDVPRREFTLFGTTFLPTDTLLLMLLLFSCLLAVFLFSALFGRVWCGWGCPQTVYMEFVFRPIERLFEGGRSGSLILDRERRWLHPRRLGKYVAYLAISLVLAHTFLAYFVGTEALARWIRLSPAEHPAPFLVMATTTLLVFTDFTWFREQTCLIACPYGRWQSVLLDRQSMIVAYDFNRGEPRRKGGKDRPADSGDCVACNACVTTCPTGIDIRNGLQMECIHCTQCMDACDHIMRAVGKPEGLIRYASRDALEGKARHVLRPRTVLYPAAFSLAFGSFLFALNTRAKADVTLLRSGAEPFAIEADGRVSNQVRVKIANRSTEAHQYAITVAGVDGAQVIAPESPLTVKPGETRSTSVFVLLPRDAFIRGRRDVTVTISAGDAYRAEFPFNLMGPATPAPGTAP
ncbi:MAG: cytochrome c oxidase accessory protein CcoG [Gemmatimonadetes bacterium]|nr:cytochrome c oxidase accessory protein CcoG [Gemmatimonadota bacterium]